MDSWYKELARSSESVDTWRAGGTALKAKRRIQSAQEVDDELEKAVVMEHVWCVAVKNDDCDCTTKLLRLRPW